MRHAFVLIVAASLSTALKTGHGALHAPARLAKPIVMQVAHTDDPEAKQAWLARPRYQPWDAASFAEMDGRIVPVAASAEMDGRIVPVAASAEIDDRVVPTDAATSALRRAAEASAWLDEHGRDDEPGATDADAQPAASAKELLRRIKDAGLAGVISFALVQTAFWGASVPVCVVAYALFTGHVPDLSDQEEMAQFGAEAFAWVNVARFAAPLRVGAALSAVPWVQANIVDRVSRARQGTR